MKGTKKKCECCGGFFIPNKRRPDQRFCRKIECIRFRDSRRQRLHYRRNIGNPSWRRDLIRRKKRERAARLEKSRENSSVRYQTSEMICDIKFIQTGIIAVISGAGNRDEIQKITEHCRCFGNDLYSKNEYNPRNIAKISSRWFLNQKREFPHVSN